MKIKSKRKEKNATIKEFRWSRVRGKRLATQFFIHKYYNHSIRCE